MVLQFIIPLIDIINSNLGLNYICSGRVVVVGVITTRVDLTISLLCTVLLLQRLYHAVESITSDEVETSYMGKMHFV